MYCFSLCKSLRRVQFGKQSKLERIGVSAFSWPCVKSLCIPDSVVELCDYCFYMCESLRVVSFGARSNLERIGEKAFTGTKIEALD